MGSGRCGSHEEAPATGLPREHREAWVRNPSGLFNPTAGPLFHNPLGHDFSDGTDESAALARIGRALCLQLPYTPPSTSTPFGEHEDGHVLHGVLCSKCRQTIVVGEECACGDFHVMDGGRLHVED